MAIEGMSPELAGNAALAGMADVNALGQAYVDRLAAPWHAGLPEEMLKDGSVQLFKDKPLAEFVKGAIEARSLVGRKLSIPKDDAPPAEWDAYFEAKGRPPSAAEYQLARPESFPEAFYDGKLEEGFRALSHKLGLNQKEAAALHDGFLEMQGQRWLAQKEAAVGELKAELKDGYAQAVADADYAVAQLAETDQRLKASILLKDPIWNNPNLVRALARIGGMLREGGPPLSGLRPEARQSAEARYKELRASEAANNREHTNFNRVNEEIKELAEKLYGKQKPI